MTTSTAELRNLREERLLLLEERQSRREKAKAETSLAEFVRLAWHVVEPATPLQWGPHLDAACLHLEAVMAGKIRDLVISIPPGCTKSLTVCVFWPAWVWTTRPHARWLFAANEESLVIRDAVACRRLIESEWYKGHWSEVFSLTSDQNVKSWYENSKRGWRTSTTVGSKTTGKKGDILVIDDPHDARKVESEADRHGVHEWYDQAFHNRVNDFKTGSRVLIGQRTHEDDLTGHLKARGDVEELRLPEEYDPAEHCRTSIGWEDWRKTEGELLRTERFGPEEVAKAKERLQQGYDAQHQQNPKSREGKRFKLEWLKRYAWVDQGFGQGGAFRMGVEGSRRVQFSECWLFQTCDPAATAEDVSKKGHDPDYTVVSTWAVTQDYHLVWLDCLRFRADIPDIVPQLEATYNQWGPEFLGIEAVAANKAVLQLAMRRPMIIRRLDPLGKDKLVRATSAMTLARSGRLWLPEKAHWLRDALNELLSFTGDERKDKHSDVVDTVSYAAEMLTEFDLDADGGGKPLLLGSRYGR